MTEALLIIAIALIVYCIHKQDEKFMEQLKLHDRVTKLEKEVKFSNEELGIF